MIPTLTVLCTSLSLILECDDLGWKINGLDPDTIVYNIRPFDTFFYPFRLLIGSSGKEIGSQHMVCSGSGKDTILFFEI